MWTGFGRLHPEVVAALKLEKIAKTAVFHGFWGCAQIEGARVRRSIVLWGQFIQFWMRLLSYSMISNTKFRKLFSGSCVLGFCDFVAFDFRVVPPCQSVILRLRSDSEKSTTKKLCDFTSHPDSFYFDIIDRFGFPDHHLESKRGCINLLYWETPLETSDSGSPTVGRWKKYTNYWHFYF